ncbi:hypothetical protein [Streptomyces resistomycificus]|uniref:hypothetical protein n=1 Tax=Streptomyces resistomycificus TaxID=67356 RepID=UPI0004ABBA62|nr:hypothetical protein [Streptomyces resistomycificus]
MTADRLAQAVRQRLGLGRLLALGGPRDGAWISEEATRAVLRHATEGLPGVRLGPLRIGPADPANAREPAVPPPPSALWPGPLRVTAEFEATPEQPLPTTADRLRAALTAIATERLGLVVAEVDLRVTALLDGTEEPAPEAPPQASPVRPPEPSAAPGAARSAEVGGGDEGRAGAAALAVTGVTRLTGLLGLPVHIEERQGESTLPRRHVRIELAVGTDRRALDVAREVRAEVERALPDQPTVAVLVTAVD